MSFNQVKNYLITKDYPNEKFKNLEESFNTIKIGLGVTFSKDLPYTYITNIKGKKLGLYVIDREAMNMSHNVGGQFSLKIRAKSHRYNEISPYVYWNNNKQKVIDLGFQHLRKYKDEYTEDELPLLVPLHLSDDVNIPEYDYMNNKNHIGLEHECCLCLFRLGIPSSFPSNLMTFMIKDYLKDNPIDNLKILDLSAGWGDRLLSACALDATYMACDPNTEMIPIYDQIINKYGTKDKQKVHCLPFEDLDERDERDERKFNMMYTSPPFFDLEIYSNEDTQSSSRYKTLESWLTGFMYPCLEKANKMLMKNSPVFLHLSDIKDNERSYKYVQNVIDYATSKLKWKYIGIYGHAVKDKEQKQSETKETREIKNASLLKPTKFIKSFKDGIRVNKFGEALSQTIWYFKT